MKKRVFFILSLLLLSIGSVVAQTTKTVGVVVDDNGQPVIGASVLVKGSIAGTMTDAEGKFMLDVPLGKKFIEVSLIGMKTERVKVAPRLKVTLESDNKLLDEVIVTGYGVTKKAAFTGSATVVGNKEVTVKSDPNFLESLTGKVAGLQYSSNSGLPGADADVTIRGAGSFNAGTKPLYIVDGTPMFSDATAADMGTGQYFDPMANINPADIESVTVLKDASATAIYGSRAANGVIVITTKRGSSGKLNINLNVKKGFSTAYPIMHNYGIVGVDKWKEMWKEGLINSGSSASDADQMINDRMTADHYNGQSTDWTNAIFRTANVDDYNLNFSGKTGKTNFYVSGGYTRNQGIIINTGMDRYTARVNLDTKYKFITFGVNTSGSYSISDGTPTAASYKSPMVAVYTNTTPDMPVRMPDGSYNQATDENPVGINDLKTGNISRQKVTSANINPYISLDLTHNFYWKTSFGLNYYSINEYQYDCPISADGAPSNGDANEFNDIKSNIIITNTLNWLKTINASHNLNLLLGQESQATSDFTEQYGAENFPLPDFRDMQNAASVTGAGNIHQYKRLASYFFNGQYDYNSRYYLSASARLDGASVFGANNRWGMFWSVGGKWRVSEEKFFASAKNVIDDLTLRASYGTVGNSDIDWYSGRGFYSTNSEYNLNKGMRPYYIENKNLGWESRNKLNVGVDVSLFKRLSLTVDLYDERTTNLLFPMPISMTTGESLPSDDTPTMLENIGEMENYGAEVAANVNILHLRNFSWDFNANITVNRNEMLKLADNQDLYPDQYRIVKEGHSINTWYLKKWAGVDPKNGDPLWYAPDGSKTNDYDKADYQIAGSADPKFYGGFGTTLHYKGFDFASNFTYSYGRQIYQWSSKYDLNDGHVMMGNIVNYVYDNAWRKPGDQTNVPKFVYGANGNKSANSPSTRFLMDGSFLRLQAITIGYTLPKTLTRKLMLSNVRVYASADNLLSVYASNYIGLNPDDDGDGEQTWSYPLSRTFTFGLNIGF